MFEIKPLGNGVGTFKDNLAWRNLWRTGITHFQFVTYYGTPLVPLYARKRLDSKWREFVQKLHIIQDND